MIPTFISFPQQQPESLLVKEKMQSRVRERRRQRSINPGKQDEKMDMDANQTNTMIHGAIKAVDGGKTTATMYKNADLCYKFQRFSSEVDDSNPSSEEKEDAQYEDYDVLPYRWCLAGSYCSWVERVRNFVPLSSEL
jgi:hypothetical protein